MPDPVTGITVAAVVGVALKQGQDFIASITGNKGESIGTILGALGRRRLTNAETVSNKSGLILLNLGLKAKEIPLPVLVQALEGASLQEDPYLQDTWANLLANAADPRNFRVVLPAFTQILKELTSREVCFLDRLLNKAINSQALKTGHPKGRIPDVALSRDGLLSIYTEAGLSRAPKLGYMTHGDYAPFEKEVDEDLIDFAEMIDSLIRNRVLMLSESTQPIDLTGITSKLDLNILPRSLSVTVKEHFGVTELGYRFILACQRPNENRAR